MEKPGRLPDVDEDEDIVFATSTWPMRRLLQMARQVAPLDCPVLIAGDPGSGHGALARVLHRTSPRARQSLRSIHCGAHDEATLEALLFGSERPRDGTLVMTEIECLPPALQERLVIDLEAETGARIIATTTADVRPILHPHLKLVTLTMPPLARRKADIPALAKRMLHIANAETGRNVAGLSEAAIHLLTAYDFPGNLTELSAVIRSAVALCGGGEILSRHLSLGIRARPRTKRPALPSLEAREREYVLRVIAEVGGNQTQAARILGINRSSLWRKLRHYEEK